MDLLKYKIPLYFLDIMSGRIEPKTHKDSITAGLIFEAIWDNKDKGIKKTNQAIVRVIKHGYMMENSFRKDKTYKSIHTELKFLDTIEQDYKYDEEIKLPLTKAILDSRNITASNYRSKKHYITKEEKIIIRKETEKYK